MQEASAIHVSVLRYAPAVQPAFAAIGL
jgi:hypothetical protein